MLLGETNGKITLSFDELFLDSLLLNVLEKVGVVIGWIIIFIIIINFLFILTWSFSCNLLFVPIEELSLFLVFK